ncbi:MAG: UDP-2,3-diacylglucosamine diphosphatase [Xanthomonadales bacterium]|nr:UDP-2,3-diacylglucosamine diphosphatase [Xanthomonadales bacterium]
MAAEGAVALISDLHLAAVDDPVFRRFRDWLAGPARRLARLYVLGDLFEAWIGDDDPDPLAAAVAEGLAGLAAGGTEIAFQHGNRDFLLGEDYARRCGMRLMPELERIELGGEPCLLLHGDLLCTGDRAYQAWRAECRRPEWRQGFLARPLAERQAEARRAREASRGHQRRLDPALADVDPASVDLAFRRFGVRRMVHGHTHRPAIHRDALGRERIVLGEWRAEGGSVLVAERGELRLERC